MRPPFSPAKLARPGGPVPSLRWSAPALVLSVLVACGAKDGDYDPPSEPPHDDVESDWVEGLGQVSAAHARGKSTPFLCHDPESGDEVLCPLERPVDRALSCDAAGCHGDFEFVEGPDSPDRHVDGSDGPSCYTCHGTEWSTRVAP